jgi:hypothetical protein
MTRIDAQREIVKGIKDRITEKGFSDVAQFCRMSGLKNHISFETARRCLNDVDRPVAPLTLAVVMRHLDYPVSEIRSAMIAVGDTVFAYMMEDSAEPMPMQDAGLLAAVQCIGQIHNTIYNDLAVVLEVMAGMVGVDVSAHISKMKKVGRARILKSQTVAEEKVRQLQMET